MPAEAGPELGGSRGRQEGRGEVAILHCSTGRPRYTDKKENQIFLIYRVEQLQSHSLQRQNTEISKQIFPEKDSVPIFTFMRL
jgi:hypothetical protein